MHEMEGHERENLSFRPDVTFKVCIKASSVEKAMG